MNQDSPTQTPNTGSLRKRKKRIGGLDGCLFGSILTFLLLTIFGYVFFKGGYLKFGKESPAETSLDTIEGVKVETAPVIREEKAPVNQSQAPISKEIAPIQVSPTQPYGEKITAIRTLSKEFDFKTEVNFNPGDIASRERVKSSSYIAEYTLNVNEPKPALTLEEVTEVNSNLENHLPELSILLENASIHPYFHKVYRLKKKRTVDNAHHLLKLLTKHNYFDCQTMLNLQHPESKRKAVLLQADMDVVADGSDGDRLPEMPEDIVTSTHYQPTTSYSWIKQTKIPNPMVAGYQQRIENADAEMAKSSTPTDRKKWLKDRKKMLLGGIAEMTKRSYLIAEYDPFIVLPVPVIVAKDSYSPNVGDYAIVFYGDKAYPAIVGDAGPDYKMGEASLRMAKEINSRASPYYRPVSDVSVTYLVFPGTRKQPHRAPDYEDIHAECLRLVTELGGLGSDLHKWENTLPEPKKEKEEVSLPEDALPSDPAFLNEPE